MALVLSEPPLRRNALQSITFESMRVDGQVRIDYELTPNALDLEVHAVTLEGDIELTDNLFQDLCIEAERRIDERGEPYQLSNGRWVIGMSFATPQQMAYLRGQA